MRRTGVVLLAVVAVVAAYAPWIAPNPPARTFPGLLHAPPTLVQLARTEPSARELFPLSEVLDPQPWMGSRPAIADSLPLIGPAPSAEGMWLAFGHAHLGFTLGPPTGRLIADIITGAKPFVDPTPYRADRF